MKWLFFMGVALMAGCLVGSFERIRKLEERVAFIETRVMAELTDQDKRIDHWQEWMDELNSNRTYIIKNVPETDFEITIHGKKKHE